MTAKKNSKPATDISDIPGLNIGLKPKKTENNFELILNGGVRMRVNDVDAKKIKGRLGGTDKFRLSTGEILLLTTVIGVINPENIIK